MTLRIDIGWLIAVMLASIRIGTLFILTPVFGSFRIPLPFRTLLVFALSMALVSVLGLRVATPITAFSELLLAGFHELIVGASFAFGLLAAFGAFLVGGRIMDTQMGFGIANVIDPSTRAQAPLLGTALNLTAVAMFFALDGHHHLIRALAFSFEQFPPGGTFGGIAIAATVAQFGAMFAFGLALVAPVIFCLLLLDIGLAFVARTMPQMNIFIVSMPLKILVGLTVLIASIPVLSPVIKAVFISLFSYWEKVLAGNG